MVKLVSEQSEKKIRSIKEEAMVLLNVGIIYNFNHFYDHTENVKMQKKFVLRKQDKQERKYSIAF